MTQLYNKSLTHDQHQCHLVHISMMFTIHFKLHVHLSQYNAAHCHDCHDQGLCPCVAKATEGASGLRGERGLGSYERRTWHSRGHEPIWSMSWCPFVIWSHLTIHAQDLECRFSCCADSRYSNKSLNSSGSVGLKKGCCTLKQDIKFNHHLSLPGWDIPIG